MKSRAPESTHKSLTLTLFGADDDDNDDDDFQSPTPAMAIAQNRIGNPSSQPQPLKPVDGARPRKRTRRPAPAGGKENRGKGRNAKLDSRVSKAAREERRDLSAPTRSVSALDSRVSTDGGKAIVEGKGDLDVVECSLDGILEERSCLSMSSESKVVGETDFDGGRTIIEEKGDLDVVECALDGISPEKSCLLVETVSEVIKEWQSGEADVGISIEMPIIEEKRDSDVVENTLVGITQKNSCVSELTELKVAGEGKSGEADFGIFKGCGESKCLKGGNGSYYSRSIEARLLEARAMPAVASSNAGNGVLGGDDCGEFEPGTQLKMLMDLCCEVGVEGRSDGGTINLEGYYSGSMGLELERDDLVECPLCGVDITGMSEESRLVHTNGCLDKAETPEVAIPIDNVKSNSPQEVVDANPVLPWLRTLGLSRYEEAFVREEIDLETLQWLTEEDLLNIGVDALGPRKKIIHALSELRQQKYCAQDTVKDVSNIAVNENTRLPLPGNKLITEYFQGPAISRNRVRNLNKPSHGTDKSGKDSVCKRMGTRNNVTKRKTRDIPPWCCIPGTPFRVDAFRYLRGDCSHWFLTHFHMDHYQGLTRNFCHGKIYCSSITAHLVNMKIGVPWDRLEILTLNQKITIAGVNLTCLDANHCPGSIIILFEPPSGKAVLHTGDFRFSAEMAISSILQSCHVHTLILDTTYCNPQYDFPKQEAVIQFVIEAIQAEAFNPRTLFLIGSYTIGKEKLFLEVARLLRKKVYVGPAKLRLLRCLRLTEEDMQWFTENEMESHIHVVPMWTIASFKRMKHISNQYSDRFNLIVAFSPTGWSFGKGKKKTPGRRWQQGTIIRYEVPYSEHCSFSELREFVRFISPEHIIPSVNNDGPESAGAMTALLMSDP